VRDTGEPVRRDKRGRAQQRGFETNWHWVILY
jgi:hypothetical protein